MPSATKFLEECSALTSGKTIVQILKDVRTVLYDPERWTQGVRALDAEGNQVRAEDPEAVCWCIEGAIGVVCNPYGVTPPHVLKALDKVVFAMFGRDCGVGYLNDMVEHEVIIQLLDEAILIEEVRDANRLKRKALGAGQD